MVVAFTIIGKGENPNSADDNHIIALIDCQEKYPEVSATVKDIATQIDAIKIGEYEFKIEFMLGMSVGIESTTANYFCIWCKCKANERYDIFKMWSIYQIPKKCLYNFRNTTVGKFEEKGNQKYGCINQPLFPTIQN